MACAIKNGAARAYLRHEWEKFAFYALDWLCILLVLLLGGIGLVCSCFLQMLQIGFLCARRRPRAFVSQKLFFFAFPAGLLAYHPRKRGYTALN